jgi:ribA/ribD-fused uncharacterized protein
MINEFRGKYYFLSNFYSVPVKHGFLTFTNTEAAFHSEKCPVRSGEFTKLNPSEAKRLGRRVRLRSDWEQVKDQVMLDVVRAKFDQHPDLAQKLLATGDEELVEGNDWGDIYWGVYKGYGKNMLGKILMRVRAELRGENPDKVAVESEKVESAEQMCLY